MVVGMSVYTYVETEATAEFQTGIGYARQQPGRRETVYSAVRIVADPLSVDIGIGRIMAYGEGEDACNQAVMTHSEMAAESYIGVYGAGRRIPYGPLRHVSR